jgi:hypothetical protein
VGARHHAARGADERPSRPGGVDAVVLVRPVARHDDILGYDAGSMALRSGDDYLASLRDGRAVFLDGRRVKDVTRHPWFAASTWPFAVSTLTAGVAMAWQPRTTMPPSRSRTTPRCRNGSGCRCAGRVRSIWGGTIA